MTSALPGSADVVIVGAGLAGLSAALELSRAGRDVLVLEAAARPGGRIVTDQIDGFRLDHGFQLINPAYPRLRRLVRDGTLDAHRLRLQQFDAGVRVAVSDGAVASRHFVLSDPRRSLRDLLSTLTAPLGSPREKARFAAWALRCATAKPARLRSEPDLPYREQLNRAGVNGRLRIAVLDPFLAGVLGEDGGQTSAHFVQLVMRSFARGTPGVPAWGMQALPEQLAAALPAGWLHYTSPVEAIEDDPAGRLVHTAGGSVRARAVLVATDGRSAAELTRLTVPAFRSLTTCWFAAEDVACHRPILNVDGDRRGPVVNVAVLSSAAPAYSPDGRALIAATMVGLPAGLADEQAIRRHAGLILGEQAGASDRWQLLRTDAIADALPALPAPLTLRQPVRLDRSLFVAGDHRDTASQQGALASGARAAAAITAELDA